MGVTPIRVLVVDDHVMVMDMLVRLLQADPAFTVVGAATTGTEAIAQARGQSTDVVVMDFLLPDMDGATATRSILAERPDVRVIMMTGSDRPGAFIAAMDAGCVACVRKTQAFQDLLEAVRRVGTGEVVTAEDVGRVPPISELVVHYQPVVDMLTRRVVGFEALVRWEHPERGLLPPAEFLALAEDTGYITQITRTVVQEATRQLSEWQQRHAVDPALWVSVNLSATTVASAHTADSIRSAIQSSSIDPACLVLEITETTLLEETPQTLASLHALKAVGVRLALDDFGTAFSSLSYLRRFPFDVIKIDHSFTAELPASPRAVLLVESISQVAHGLGLTAIAEGIERQAQARCLIGAGWRYGQGFLYSRPVKARAAERLLQPPRQVSNS
jgi:EAL domain-containing protein (putative c-di-GMP-specific phosphodiesterase class I)